MREINMKKIRLLHLDLLVIALVWLTVIVTDAEAGIISNRDELPADVFLDDYNHTNYTHGDEHYLIKDKFSDEHMSSIMGHTQYKTTMHLYNGNTTSLYTLFEEDENGDFFESTDRYYCGGCNGSFELSWDNASAVGLDIASNYSSNPYHAWVTYGDGSQEDFALPLEERARITTVFWGITSDLGIKSIHFGNPYGETTYWGSFAIDNLAIGDDRQVAVKSVAVKPAAIPAPATLGLFLIGLLGMRRWLA